MVDNKTKELAVLAKDAYENKTKLNDFKKYTDSVKRIKEIYSTTENIYSKIETHHENQEDGFKANVYHKKDSDEIIIAFAGTKITSFEDIKNDYNMLIGNTPQQINDAIYVYEQVKKENPNAKITLTGHSLGGMLATQVFLYDYKKQLNELGGINKENVLKLKEKGIMPNVTVFETPSPFLPLDTKRTGQLWKEHKDFLELYGYKAKINEDNGLTQIVYDPDESSLSIYDLNMVSYQNANSYLTQSTGIQIGVINNIESTHYNGIPILSQHFIDNLEIDLNDDTIPITYNYQESQKGKSIDNDIVVSLKNTLDSLQGLSTGITNNALRVYNRQTDPFIIDMNGNGIDVHSNKIYYNLDDSGFNKSINWVQKDTDDAFLVYDKNQNQQIDGISEMFGNQRNGLSELKELDSTKDNRIDATDSEFSNLYLWKDKNANGITDKGELQNLNEAGIKSINLKTFKKDNSSDGHLNHIVGKMDVDFNNGSSKKMYEYELKIDRQDAKYEKIEISDEIKETVPYMTGLGNVADTWTSAQNDEQLKTMFQEMINSDNYTNWDKQTESSLFRWTGVDKLDLSNLSSSEQIRMRKQYALEKFEGNPLNSDTSYFSDFKRKTNYSFEQLKEILKLNMFASSEIGNELITSTLKDIFNKSDSLESIRSIIDNIGLTSKEREREVLNLYTNFLHFNGLDKEIYNQNPETLRNFSSHYEYSGVGLIEAWKNNAFNSKFFKKTETHPVYEQSLFENGYEYQGKQIIDSGFYGIPERYTNILKGYNNDDVFISSSQNETITGNYGSDTYFWGVHKGNDLIEIRASNNSSSTPPTENQKNALDTIKFDFTINPENIEIYQQEYGSCNLIFRNNNTNETLSVKVFGTLKPNHDQKLQCKFADGTVWDEDYLKSHAILIHNKKNQYAPYDDNVNRKFVNVGNLVDVKSLNSFDKNGYIKENKMVSLNQNDIVNLYQNNVYSHSTNLRI